MRVYILINSKDFVFFDIIVHLKIVFPPKQIYIYKITTQKSSVEKTISKKLNWKSSLENMIFQKK